MSTPAQTRTYLRFLFRVLCVLSALAALWAAFLWLTGGFHVQYGALRISSRRPRNAAVIAAVCALLTWLLTFLPDGRSTLRHESLMWLDWYASSSSSRGRASRVIRIIASAFTIAAIGIAIDVFQWRAALPLWVDEETIALNIRDRAFGDLAGVLWMGQSAPFGWLVLEKIAMAVLGTGEAALRAVPLLFGIATVCVAAWVGRRWMEWAAALVFVVLCWIGPLLSHYRFEVKHYSADVFFGLLLPALAVWAVEVEHAQDRARRVWLWWSAAAIGLWLANGALLVTPACVIFLAVMVWRKERWSAATWFSLAGAMWVASFGLHYLISARYTLNSAYLRSTWSTELLPPSMGVIGSLRWFGDRLAPLASNPAGTTLWPLLWMSAICGWIFGATRRLGSVLAGVTVSAFAFASIVPLHQRFSIWMVPALYAGVALLIDAAVRLGRDAFARRRWVLLVPVVLILFFEYQLFSDILMRGRADVEARRNSTYKHQLDDRAAIRWLMSRRRTGDVLMSTQLALPAVWWYGSIPIFDGAGGGGVHPDGSPIYEVSPGTDCSTRELEDAIRNHPRVLLYLGFDVTGGFDRALLRNLAQRGAITAHEEFSELGLAAVFDLQRPASGSIEQFRRVRTAGAADSGGCVSVRRAQRW